VDFQRMVSPLYCPFPSAYVHTEDEELALTACGATAPLNETYDADLGASKLVYQCARYLRLTGGISSKGVFRVPGDNQVPRHCLALQQEAARLVRSLHCCCCPTDKHFHTH